MEDKGSAPSASDFAGIGLQFAVSIILFVFAGQWLDRKLGTEPVFLIVGAFMGAGGSFYSMYRKLMASQRGDVRDGVRKEDKKDVNGGGRS